MIAGCYSIDCYCSNSEEASEESLFKCATIGGDVYRGGSISVTGETERDCLSQIQTRGWKISKRDNRHFCPKCVRADRVW